MQNVFVVLYTADKSVDAPINQYYGVYSTLESAKRGIEVALDPRYGPDLSSSGSVSKMILPTSD